MVDEADHALRIQNDDAFLQRLEDFFEKALFVDQAGDDLLDLAVFDAIQAGDEFFEKSGFHGKFARWEVGPCRWRLGASSIRGVRSCIPGIHGSGKGMDEVLIVFCTFPDVALARQIGTALVEKQLAACVNLIPAVESIYRWQGRVESSTEVLAVFKTSAAVSPRSSELSRNPIPMRCRKSSPSKPLPSPAATGPGCCRT